ncbi:ABC transporter ATP-binding protein [Oceanobacillus alkalisoli]|uniref:ABC transporter ATP-binding protein n=1 Tax=Oceanobacillus alkalisoli TaxID=2925113 RepID=UPI001F11D246|nr:ABC transporter ATP-binding protein [Oceanobacillus alkalisoli]MCF3944249.1 ABC transporter ATP-binding protein/permease [Oceanobacillus alkalisoli]
MVNVDSISIRSIIFTFSLWPRIFNILWKANQFYFFCILVLSISRGLMPALTLIATQQVVNTIVLNNQTSEFNIVLVPLAVFVSLFFLNELLMIFQMHTSTVYQTYLSNHVKVEIIKKVGKMSLPNFENSLIQDQLQRSQQEADFRPYEIFQQILSIITGAVTLVSSAGILLTWNWKLTLLLGLVPILFFFAYLSLGKKEFLIHYHRVPNQRKSWYLLQLQTRDSSFKEAKIYRLSNYLLKEYRNIINQFLKEDKFLANKRTQLSIVSQLCGNIIVGIIVFYVAYAGFYGDINIGNLVAYFSAITLTYTNSQTIVWDIVDICKNNLYIQQLFFFLDLKDGHDEGALTKDKQTVFFSEIETIEFRNVYFKYPATENYVLKNVNFKLRRGETLALVGQNGSGKSTIIKLICKLYNDYEGEILINGISIRDIPTELFYKELGVVFQDFVNYEMSLWKNVGFGDIDNLNDENRVNDAIEKSGLTAFVQTLPKQKNTQLGKYFLDGYQLSGGQWQRLAIARAFMRDASLYILDEPSAALDSVAEANIFKKFGDLVEGRIGIFISHRYTSMHFADHILVLQQGEVVERGTHEELLEIAGVYPRLYRLQMNNLKKAK